MRVPNTTFTQSWKCRSSCSVRIAAAAAAAAPPAHKAAVLLLPLPQLLPPAHMAALVAEVEEPQIRARLLWMDGQEGFDVPQRGRHALTRSQVLVLQQRVGQAGRPGCQGAGQHKPVVSGLQDGWGHVLTGFHAPAGRGAVRE
jgi:hypothetical protein